MLGTWVCEELPASPTRLLTSLPPSLIHLAHPHTEAEVRGTRVCEELLPGGSRLSVTRANVRLYVHLLADWHLNRRLGAGAAAFGRGLGAVSAREA